METVPCPISNSTEFSPWLELPDRLDASRKARWQLVRSSVSGLVILNPRPDSSEIASHYHSSLYDPFLHEQNAATLKEKAYLAARSLLLRYRARLILHGALKPARNLSILEIGSSTGDLLNFFHRKIGVKFAHLAGVEPDAASAAHCRERYGIRVSPSLTGFVEKFDRIVLWHTLEHIHDLHETLQAVAGLLEPDGQLVIALPNPACSGANHYRENWVAFDAPRHLYHFMPGTLKKLLELHEFTLFREHSYWPDALYNALYSEQLCCERHGRQFNVLRLFRALYRGTVEAVRGIMRPGEGAGVVYFATLRPRAFSS